jgi:DNA (cytosine-5)-methyltransferase 1
MGFDYAQVLSELDEAGYDARWQVLNSKDYFTPQNRERVFIIANLRSRGRREILPVGGANQNTLKQIIGGMQGYRVYDSNGIATTIVGNAGGVGAKTGLYLIDQSLKNPKITETARCVTSRYTAGIVNRSASNSGVLEVYPILTPNRLEKRQNGRRIKNSNEPMFTITSCDQHGIIINDRRKDDVRASEICPTLLSRDYKSPKKVIVDRMFNPYNKSEITDTAPTQTGTCGSKTSSSAVMIMKNCRIRRLTPKECFLLQGFPDALFEKARAVNSDAQLYKQAGNAVTVNVAYVVAKSVADCEDEIKCIMNKK